MPNRSTLLLFASAALTLAVSPAPLPAAMPAPAPVAATAAFPLAAAPAPPQEAPDSAAAQDPQEAPALVVFVVVDQMRADLLTRYADVWTEGFKRLMEGGMVYGQASHKHAYTETAAGHATLSTGTFPSRHGIVGNEWSIQATGGWRSVYALEDPSSDILGYPSLPGRSPANLLRTGLADWVQEADSEARVASVSTKDRAAITMAGRSKGDVYWVSEATGIFSSSEYYKRELPNWVENFNDGVMPSMYRDTLWASGVPANLAPLSRPDTFAFEGDGVHTFFPHNGKVERREDSDWGLMIWVREWTPRLDMGTLELALLATRELELGQRGHTDYLGISFSQHDYVGHRFGPYSREELDNLLRVDHLLGRLMAQLDAQVGQGRWVMALSADHGVLQMPEWRAENGLPGARVTLDQLRAYRDTLRAGLTEGGSVDEIRDRVAAAAERQWFIEKVYRQEELLAGEQPDSFAPLFRNSYYPGRIKGTLSRLGFMERQPEGTLMSDGEAYGTSHGSAYWYDRWVPLVFYGAGVEPGWSDEAVYTVDVAPTLAALAGIATPADLDGRPLISR